MTTVNTDLIIYDDLAQTAFLERRQDNLAIFNASSNGAILLDNELIEGDFRKRAFYKVGGSIESRDVNSTEKVTGKKIGAGEAVSVKAPWKYGPYETTEEAFKRRGRSVDEFSEVIGTDVADATLEGYVKYGLKALTAAIGATGNVGWHINKSGYATFNNVTVRGSIYATNGNFSFNGSGNTTVINGNGLTVNIPGGGRIVLGTWT